MNLGMTEMIFIFLLALLIFGPTKLPEIGRQIGRGLGEFKRASNEFKNQFEDEVRKLEEEKKAAPPPPEPPTGTVAKGGPDPQPVNFSKLSHDPAWEDPQRETSAPAVPETPAHDGAAPERPPGEHVG